MGNLTSCLKGKEDKVEQVRASAEPLLARSVAGQLLQVVWWPLEGQSGAKPNNCRTSNQEGLFSLRNSAADPAAQWGSARQPPQAAPGPAA